jgi:hypothetical protein
MCVAAEPPDHPYDKPPPRELYMFRSPLVCRLLLTIALLVGAGIAGGWKWTGLPH